MAITLEASITKTQTAVEKYNPYTNDTIQYVFRDGFVNEDVVQSSADITDEFVEDNSAVQDHMAIKPMRYTVRGFIAEKSFTPLEPYFYDVPTRETDYISTAYNLLGVLSPTLSSYMQTAVAAYQYVESSYQRYAGTITNIAGALFGTHARRIDATSTADYIPDSKQERAFYELKNLQYSRTLVTIDSPFAFMSNFLIEDVRMEQGNDIWHSEVVVQLKQYNSVETILTSVDAKSYESRVSKQYETEQNLGQVQGKDGKLQSTLYQILKSGKNVGTYLGAG